MIKRIAVLFAFTGAAYGFSILTIKYLAKEAAAEQVAGIAEVESLIQFLIGLIGFGIQTEAIRSISFSENWKEELAKAQRARITFSLILCTVCLLSFENTYYLYFLLSPILAASSDYALYAKGFATVGAGVAFCRVITPLLFALLASVYFPNLLLEFYVIANFVIYLLTDAYIAYFLKVSLYFKPKFSSLLLYQKTIPIGIINLCLYFLGLGILLLGQLWVTELEMILAFVALKFYLVFKGALRVIQQGFVNRMLEDQVCFSIDMIGIMFSVLFLGGLWIFPDSVISLLFGKQFIANQLFFFYLGLAAICFSLFNSANTRALLERKDYQLMKIALFSVTVCGVLFSATYYFLKQVEAITISLLVGEAVFSSLLAISFFKPNQVLNRIKVLAFCLVGLVLPWAFKSLWQDSLLTFLISFGLLGIIMLTFSHKKLVLPQAP